MITHLPRHHVAWLAFGAFGVLAACSDDDPTQPVTPNPPGSVQVTSLTSTSARVTFAAVSGASGYVIERAAGAAGGTFTALDTITAPPFDDTGLTPQATYRYRVASLSGSLRSAAQSLSQRQGVVLPVRRAPRALPTASTPETQPSLPARAGQRAECRRK